MPPTFSRAGASGRGSSRQRYDRDRDAGHAWRAWYKTSRWQKLRAAHLAANPLCAFCDRDGIATPALICDHVEPHRGDAERFWSGPFQSLCKPHHDGEKQRQERRGLLA